MKKMKKVLTGIISAAMLISSAAMTAFAAQETEPVTTTPATINTAQEGSLTIHKYEYNGDEATPGTGFQSDAVPEGANPLAGAGFTIYKVADVNALDTYYSTNPTNLPDIGSYVENGAIKTTYADKKVGDEVVTETDGIAKFSGLELGFYVVIETTKPAAVTSAVAPFIVSVPMTTADGGDWLYDVHVYPKNGTKYGEVKLEKSGVNGAKLAGVTFALQKKNGDSWTTITKKAGAAGDNTGDALNLTTNASGLISVDGLTQGTYRFIETSVGNNHGYIMDGATAYEFVVTAEGKVQYGDADAAESVTIPVTNDKPDMTKQVKDRTTSKWQQDSDYNIGDKIEYKITVDVPNNITKLKEFTVTDTPTNLKDDTATVALTCEDVSVEKAAYEVAAYAVTENAEKNGFTVTFAPAQMAAYAGKQIVITYKADLLSSAVTTTAGNPNTAKLEYSNEIFPDSDDSDNPNTPENPGEEPGKDVIKDNAVIYTFKLTINKTDGNSAKLAGVVFDLYKEVENGTEEAVQGNSDNGLDTTKQWLKLDTLTTDTNGTVSKSGLANGTYYLVETKTNDGYNLLKAPVAVELNIAYKTAMTETWEWDVDENGVKTLVKHEITSSETTFTNTDDDKGKDGVEVQDIVNKKGFTLPTTGGMGILMFSIIGAILMMGGAMVLFRSEKRKTA